MASGDFNQMLVEKIKRLEAENARLRKENGIWTEQSKTWLDLGKELVTLRARCERMEAAVRDIVNEYEALDKLEYPLRPIVEVMRAKNWAYVVCKTALAHGQEEK